MPIEDYQLLEPISANGWCVRYHARDANQSAVEVRILHESLKARGDWVAVVKRLRLVALVRHSAICATVETDPFGSPAFIAMAPPPQATLAESPSKQHLGLPAAVHFVRQLAEGLAAAHRLGLPHGAINPETILVRANGEGVVDLTGLLRNALGDPNAEHGLAFRPPEFDLREAPDSPGDIYCLAAVLRWLVHAQPKQEAMEPILATATATDPMARPSAGQFASQLAALEQRLQAVAVKPGTIAQTIVAPGATQLHQTITPIATSCSRLVDIGMRLGRFQLLEKLGEGGMGAVYRARDIADDTTVAVKVLHERLANDPESRRRFAKEARLLAKANNPFVASLLEFNEDGGVHFLAVEFVPGGSVGRLLTKRQRFDEAAALAIAADAARGLAVPHQRGIVHRDVKPDNLLLTAAGQTALQDGEFPIGVPIVKLADFGLARTNQQTESLAMTQVGSLLGTPLYMSPEQCRGQAVDARSDVYSLGATLFHLLVGKPPFEADSPVAVINKHCHEPPPSLNQLRPELSEATVRVMEKCLAKNADARYADAGELLADLDRLLRGTPTSLVLHPPTPDAAGDNVLEFSFAWDLSSSPAQLWPYVSHTDRVNHAMGLPAVRYTTRVDPVRGVERFAETKLVGQRVAWQEHPYEWIEGRRMSVLREFTSGPFNWFVNVVDLQPRNGGGARLTQTLKVSPKGWIGRLLARISLGRKSQQGFGRTYRHVDEYLSRGSAVSAADDPFGRRAVMPTARRERLRQRLDRLREQRIEPQVVETLGQFLEHGSDLDVARIRPLAFAERFGLDPLQVVSACLVGVREGLLTLLWDILCPTCRIPADVQETLAALKDHGYCEACDMRYQIDFANSVELIFRAHPELRAVETRTYCIGGPAWSAHVVAQMRLAVHERFAMELSLSEGSYRIRGPQLPFAVEFRVAPRSTISRWELPLSRPPLRETVPTLRPGEQVLTLVNDTPHELQVRIERTASRADAFTAAAASSMAVFREMFPEQILSPGQIVSVAHVTLLAAQIDNSAELYRRLGDGPAFGQVRQRLTWIDDVIRQHGGAVVKTIGDGLLATFPEPLAAVQAALELLLAAMRESSETKLQLAVHRGSAMVTTLNDRLDYFGGTVHRLHELLARCDSNEAIVSEVLASTADVFRLAQDRGVIAEVVRDDRFLAQRWRVGHQASGQVSSG